MVEDIYRLKKMYALDPPKKAWKQFAALFDLKPLKMANNSGAIENHTWIAGRSIFAQVSMDGNLHYHTQDHLSRSGDLLFVHRYLAGGADGRSGDVPYMMRPGMMIFHDYGRPFEGVQLPSTIQSVYLRHDVIGYDPSSMPPQIMFDQNSPEGAALFSTFDTFMPELLSNGDTLKKEHEQRLIEQVRKALPEPHVSPSERFQVQLYLEDNLANPELSEEDLLAKFEMSRARLFDLFSIYGGVSHYVLTRRVFHALFELDQHPERFQDLDQTAMTWGFRSERVLIEAVERVYRAKLNQVFDP